MARPVRELMFRGWALIIDVQRFTEMTLSSFGTFVGDLGHTLLHAIGNVNYGKAPVIETLNKALVSEGEKICVYV
jgi:hypothetical protein